MTNDFDFSFDIDQIEIILRYNIFETGCGKYFVSIKMNK